MAENPPRAPVSMEVMPAHTARLVILIVHAATALAALGALHACASRLAPAPAARPAHAPGEHAAGGNTALSHDQPTAAGATTAPATMTLPALLAVGQQVHLLVLESDRAVCQAWTIEDDHSRPIQEHAFRLARRIEHAGRAMSLRFDYAWDAGRLELIGYNRSDEAGDELALGQSGGCREQWSVAEHPGSLDVGGSVWFAHASDCESAREATLPVATDFGACNAGLALPDDTAADDGMRSFDALMRRGGALYQLDATGAGPLACERWSVQPTRRGHPGGDLVRVEREGETVTTVTYGYGWSPAGMRPESQQPEIMLTGPSITTRAPLGASSMGYACLEIATVSAQSRDAVQLDGNPVYLDQGACEAAHLRIHARLRWLPPQPGDPGERMARMAGRGLPGC
jgi:hypothetical protein